MILCSAQNVWYGILTITLNDFCSGRMLGNDFLCSV